MKVLVTGGEGFIGRHLVERFRAFEHDVSVYDLMTGGDLMNMSRLNASMIRWRVSSCRSARRLNSYLRVTFDFHFAYIYVI